jgi:hypothetical protein
MDTKDAVTLLGGAVAVYRAVLSTLNFLTARRKDGVQVAFSVMRDVTPAKKKPDAAERATIVSVTNIGQRPVTLMAFGATLVDSNMNWLTRETGPGLPFTLTESLYVGGVFDAADGRLPGVESWVAKDTAGRRYYEHEKPWYRRLWSRVKRLYAPVTYTER